MKTAVVTLGVLVLCCAFLGTECSTELEDVEDYLSRGDGDYDLKFDANAALQNIENLKAAQESRSLEISPNRCNCNGGKSCGCCITFKWKVLWFVKLKCLACIKMTPLPGNNVAYLVYALNHRHVYKQRISLLVLPRPCRGIPHFLHYLSKSNLCLEFSHHNVHRRYFCAHITGYVVFGFKSRRVFGRLGCFTLPRPRADEDQDELESDEYLASVVQDKWKDAMAEEDLMDKVEWDWNDE